MFTPPSSLEELDTRPETGDFCQASLRAPARSNDISKTSYEFFKYQERLRLANQKKAAEHLRIRPLMESLPEDSSSLLARGLSSVSHQQSSEIAEQGHSADQLRNYFTRQS